MYSKFEIVPELVRELVSRKGELTDADLLKSMDAAVSN